MEDKNYIKLAQIYNGLAINQRDEYFDIQKTNGCIKAIVKNDFDINYKLPSTCFICQSKPQYAGNTALHFIMEFYDDNLIDIFDVLIERGADLTIQNDNGYTPLLLAFLKDKKINEILHRYFTVKNFENIHCKNGISHFHVACSTNLTEIIDCYLKTGVSVNERVNDDSPNFAGYTPLHFAMQYCQPQTIWLLLNNDASLESKDSKMMTPLHVLIQSLLQKAALNDEINKFLQSALCNNLFDLPDYAGLANTHLSCILENFEFENQSKNIDNPVNLDSPICAGYTPLHFAAHFHFRTVILLLKAGANLLAKDINGTTPFDLCLKKFNLNEIIQILSEDKQHHLSRLKFESGVPVLIALYAMQNDNAFNKYLNENPIENVVTRVSLKSPIWPGYTLFHLTVLFNGLVFKVLDCGASLEIQDANSMTPLHIAFRIMKHAVLRMLDFYLKKNKKNRINYVDHDSLSFLHIASAARHVRAVKSLLEDKQSDPNLSLSCDFEWELSQDCNLIKAGSTPLHIAVRVLCSTNHELDLISYQNYEFIDLLLGYGANPNIADSDGVTPYHIALKHQHQIIFNQLLKSDSEFDCEKKYEKLGLTRLQIACFLHDLSMVKQELASGADVNKRIDLDSKIWPGDTALHILYRKKFESRNEFVKLLLAHGADPSLQNKSNLTPVHLSNGKLFEIPTFSPTNDFFFQNPINNQGQSHFHMSCMTDNLLVTENFIKSGIDVNTTIDYFANFDAGYTPLHYAVVHGKSKLIELLLNNGADPNIKALNGFTSLHLAALEGNYNKMHALLRCPTLDIQAKDALGHTALEMIIRTKKDSQNLCMIALIYNGAGINFTKLINEGFDSFIFKVIERVHFTYFRHLIANYDLTVTDNDDQNVIHHIALHVSNCDFFVVLNNINVLIDNGCEIDHKNIRGETALHLATFSNNIKMVVILLALGADINIKDDEKKIPYTYVSDYKYNIKKIFMRHISKLEEGGFYVNELNKRISHDADFFKKGDDKNKIIHSYSEENEKGNLLLIFEEQQQEKEEFYLRLKKKIKRTKNRLLAPAANSIIALTNLDIPEEMRLEIVNYLNNDDLMNLVRAVNGKLEFSPLI